MDDKNYYCVKALFSDTDLTMSVNIRVIVNNRLMVKSELFDCAIAYFKKNSKKSLEKTLVYKTESDMHACKKPFAEHIVDQSWIIKNVLVSDETKIDKHSVIEKIKTLTSKITHSNPKQ